MVGRSAANSYGFAAFTVHPGTRPGGVTWMTVTYYDATEPDGQLRRSRPSTLYRRRRDSAHS